MLANILHNMPKETDHIPSPLHFTYPFAYEPHPLCIEAVREITPRCRQLLQGEKGGKMFGVLIVEHPDTGQRSYLAAFSGIIQGTYLHDGFVPPVYNLQRPDSYFQEEQARINALNQRIASGEDNPALYDERRRRSHDLQYWLFSQFHMLNALGQTVDLPEIFQGEPRILSPEEYFKHKNSQNSQNSQNSPLSQRLIPPAGSGECCAPKLLQYAYAHQLRPLCMAEFWLGPSPKDEPRIDGNYYPSCHAKCRPILRHMLQGLEVDENPMLRRNREQASRVEYIYADADILVVYKPSGLLSAPGKDDVPSLLDIVRRQYPSAMYAHRLDMDTSGLMVFSLHDAAYKHLQNQFYRHEVEKHYIALLDGEVAPSVPSSGTIRLPLLPNPYDRPRQMVNYEHGKQAITHYEILHTANGQTRIKFNPQTGRTHQLRLHSAHADGLGCPIKGDNLYGSPSDRLYLHAERLAFTHPATGKWIEFVKEEI